MFSVGDSVRPIRSCSTGGSLVRSTCGSHGDKRVSIVPGLLVRTMRYPNEKGGTWRDRSEGDGRVFQVPCMAEGRHSGMYGCWVSARDGSKERVGRHVRVWGEGWGIECAW